MNAPLDRATLAKILGMLGSAHPGEVLNAARKAEDIRRAAGLTWHEIVGPALTAPQPVILYDRDAINLALSRADLLSDWERTFVGSLRHARYPLSDRQLEILDQIVVKVRRAAARAA